MFVISIPIYSLYQIDIVLIYTFILIHTYLAFKNIYYLVLLNLYDQNSRNLICGGDCINNSRRIHLA